MRLRPVNDRIVVQRDQAATQSPGGIILPNAAADKPTRGRAIAVGPGKILADGSRAPMDVKAGQSLIFRKYGGDDVMVGTDEFVMICLDDVLAVIEDEE